MNNQFMPVTFHADTIYCVEHEGQPFTPVKPIVENLGLSWGNQTEKLQNTPHLNCSVIRTVAPDGKNREMLCIPVRKVTAFLYSINANKVRPDLRDKLIQYQEECDDVLWKYWMERKAASSKGISLPHRMLSAKMVFEAANKHGSALAEALDLVYQDATGTSALQIANITLDEPQKESLALPPARGPVKHRDDTHYISVTKIGDLYGISGRAVNKILTERGLVIQEPRIVGSRKPNGTIVKRHAGYYYRLTDKGIEHGGIVFPEGAPNEYSSWRRVLWDENAITTYLDTIIK